MPDRKRTIDAVDESSARLRLFMDCESMGDLAAMDPDPDLEQVRPDPTGLSASPEGPGSS